MDVYLDTNLWNALFNQNIRVDVLLDSLEKRDIRLVLSEAGALASEINIRDMGLHLDLGVDVPRDLSKSMEQENGLALGSLGPQAGNHACAHREACKYCRAW